MIARIGLPLLAGTLFGSGLALGGMTDPARVRGFLDIFGDWDPTLAFVMAGAVLVMAAAWRIQKRLGRPLLADAFALPERSDVTAPLVMGAAVFGIGWGIAGLCPGPALAVLSVAPLKALWFVGAMLAGMVLHKVALRD
ncbi:DUF6691 family protein [Tsuneonella sp. SYSU-LHT278]|uniref:DUF6691 family protein n=1 Tax=Tsuneonella sediminis TaxID=3416089 RepID=UPI003F796B8C